MKGRTIGLIVAGILILVIVAGLNFYPKSSSNDTIPVYDVGISEYVKLFDDCKAIATVPMAQRTEQQRLCPENFPSDSDIEKLRLLKDYQGVPITLTGGEVASLEEIWSSEFQTKNAVGKTIFNKIGVYQNKEYTKNFIILASGSPPETKIFDVTLEKSTLASLEN